MTTSGLYLAGKGKKTKLIQLIKSIQELKNQNLNLLIIHQGRGGRCKRRNLMRKL